MAGLAPAFLRATEAAAIAAGRMRGCGDNKAADAAAVAAMRTVFDTIAFDGRVAIGEGERDEAPMLWIGEPLGSRQGDPGAIAVDIAIDPLECTNNCARDDPDALAVLAAAPRGALLLALIHIPEPTRRYAISSAVFRLKTPIHSALTNITLCSQ